MKKILIGILAAGSMMSANAVTWWVNGVLYGNVCRNGAFYTVYPINMGQPVGSLCPVRNNAGYIIGQGIVTDE